MGASVRGLALLGEGLSLWVIRTPFVLKSNPEIKLCGAMTFMIYRRLCGAVIHIIHRGYTQPMRILPLHFCNEVQNDKPLWVKMLRSRKNEVDSSAFNRESTARLLTENEVK